MSWASIFGSQMLISRKRHSSFWNDSTSQHLTPSEGTIVYQCTLKGTTEIRAVHGEFFLAILSDGHTDMMPRCFALIRISWFYHVIRAFRKTFVRTESQVILWLKRTKLHETMIRSSHSYPDMSLLSQIWETKQYRPQHNNNNETDLSIRFDISRPKYMCSLQHIRRLRLDIPWLASSYGQD